MEGWETQELGRLCVIKTGRKDVNQGNPDGEYPFFTCAKDHTYSDEFSFAGEAILIAGNGDVGNVSYYNGKFEAYQRTYVLMDFDRIIPPYLFRVLEGTLKAVLYDQKLGNTMPYIKKGMLTEFPIPLPSLPEQERIVAILDDAFAAIATATANAEKNLANAQDLFESHLSAIFNKVEGWAEKTLKRISTQFGRGKSRHRPRNAKKLYGGKYPFIQTGDIRNSEHLITTHVQTYSELGLAQSKLWPKGTVCITIAANIAETGVLEFDACIPDSVIGLVADPREADGMFVEYLLQSFKVALQAKGKGSAQANINMGTFEHLVFPFPDVGTQRVIAGKLDALAAETQQLTTFYHRDLMLLRELKQSILHKAFTGELTSRMATRTLEAVND